MLVPLVSHLPDLLSYSKACVNMQNTMNICVQLSTKTMLYILEKVVLHAWENTRVQGYDVWLGVWYVNGMSAGNEATNNNTSCHASASCAIMFCIFLYFCSMFNSCFIVLMVGLHDNFTLQHGLFKLVMAVTWSRDTRLFCCYWLLIGWLMIRLTHKFSSSC